MTHREELSPENDGADMPLWAACFPIVFVILGLALNFRLMGMDALDGPNQLTLILAGVLVAALAKIQNISWERLQASIVESISGALPAILLVLIIGALIASWILSGIVPALVYYGLEIIVPRLFFPTALILCAATSVIIGSSWSTTATIGIALFGVSQALGLHPGLSIGAIISGAYFGDKMSPVSDTTNLAAACAKVELFRHIAHMRVTTVPAFVLTLVIFTVAGLTTSTIFDAEHVSEIQAEIAKTYNLNPTLLLVPLIIGVVIARRTPAFLALILATAMGAVAACIAQGHLVAEIAQTEEGGFLYIGIMKALSLGFDLPSAITVTERISRAGGMAGMMPTIWLIISAMFFGGALGGSGSLRRVTTAIFRFVSTPGRLIASTAGSAVFMNVAAADHFLAIVVPSRVFSLAYEKLELAPENMSRALEDAGTVTSPLVPWNTCGAFQASVFAVDPFLFIPYCFFNILSPIISVFVGYAGIGVTRLQTKNFAAND